MLVYLISLLILLLLGGIYNISLNIGTSKKDRLINLAYISFIPYLNTFVAILFILSSIINLFKDNDNKFFN